MEKFNPGEISRDQQSEVVLHFLDRAKKISAFHGAEVKDVFSNPENIRNLVVSLSETDFIDLLNGLNGVIRGKEKSDWGMYAGAMKLEGGGDVEYPPHEKDRLELFHDAYIAMREMGEENRSLEDISILLASSINAIHAYEDANGRTSRLVYTLINRGYNEQTKGDLKKLLGEDGRVQLDVDPSITNSHLNDIIADELGAVKDETRNPKKLGHLMFKGKSVDLGFAEGVSDADKDFMRKIVRGDERFTLFAFYKYFQTLPNPDDYISVYPAHSSIRVDLLLPKMTPQEISHVLDTYWSLKKHRVELLIDSIRHPDKPEYEIESDNVKISLLDELKSRITPSSREL